MITEFQVSETGWLQIQTASPCETCGHEYRLGHFSVESGTFSTPESNWTKTKYTFYCVKCLLIEKREVPQ